MSAVILLGHAQQILNKPRADGLAPRMAAFLARQALEEIIVSRCARLGAPVESANARSRLIVLRALDTADAADSASRAWSGLSNACHVHAFELQPSASEIKHLCGVVASLLPA
ncbi:hypothetical protein [Mycolicibacterium mucogenicum]|uniref:hypothetical protein n=1 Tax=Mycolicibacterium mucogenicum TaxID=56689 RepID=UPI0009F4B971|nr:hypothetical protein [Mycolicibacterium mucogenicum]